MPFWHVHLSPGSPVAHLVHNQTDDDGGVWSGDIEIWRGAPAWTDHPELEHAVLGIMNLAVHADFIRHRWTFDIPDRYNDKWNCGDDREWMVLKATGGPSCWTLVLRFPKRTPQFVWTAVAEGFHAQLVGAAVPERSRVLAAAIASAEAPADAAFLERLDDGAGGVKPFPGGLGVSPPGDPGLPAGSEAWKPMPDRRKPAPLPPRRSRLSLAQRVAISHSQEAP